MKLRIGFVSNSSSSSFVVATDGDVKVKLSIEVDLSSYGTKIETLDDLERYIIDWWGIEDTLKDILEEESFLREIYEGAKKAIDAGKVVFAGLFASDGDSVESFIHYHGLPEMEGVDIIQGRQG